MQVVGDVLRRRVDLVRDAGRELPDRSSSRCDCRSCRSMSRRSVTSRATTTNSAGSSPGSVWCTRIASRDDRGTVRALDRDVAGPAPVAPRGAERAVELSALRRHARERPSSAPSMSRARAPEQLRGGAVRVAHAPGFVEREHRRRDVLEDLRLAPRVHELRGDLAVPRVQLFRHRRERVLDARAVRRRRDTTGRSAGVAARTCRSTAPPDRTRGGAAARAAGCQPEPVPGRGFRGPPRRPSRGRPFTDRG